MDLRVLLLLLDIGHNNMTFIVLPVYVVLVIKSGMCNFYISAKLFMKSSESMTIQLVMTSISGKIFLLVLHARAIIQHERSRVENCKTLHFLPAILSLDLPLLTWMPPISCIENFRDNLEEFSLSTSEGLFSACFN